MLEKRIDALNACVFYSMLVYPICATVRKVGLFDLAGKAVLLLMLISLLALFCLRKQSKASWLILALVALMHAIELANPISSKESFTTYLMYPVWVLFFIYILNNYNSFFEAAKSRKRILEIAVILWEAIVSVSAIFPSSYEHTWGEGSYFISFSNTSFELAPAASLIMALVIFCYVCDGNSRKAALLSLVPLICSFASGSRTYLAVIILEALILAMMVIKSKMALLAFVVAVLAVGIGLIGMTNIAAKFVNAFQYSNDANAFWSVFTSGRSAFWAADVKAFFDGSAWNQLFGYGFSFVYEVNQTAVGNRIYAHNDFINILLTFGWVGLVPYLYVFGSCFRILGKKMGSGFACVILGIWLFNAVFNMVYVYMSAIFGIGLLMVSASSYCETAHVFSTEGLYDRGCGGRLANGGCRATEECALR